MFEALGGKLEGALRKLRGRGVIRPADIEGTMKEVRMALLEADVNFQVVKDFCTKVAEKALGEEVLKSLTPDQQIIRIVHQELVAMMGEKAAALNLAVAPPAIVMLVGLQGSGKTTTCAKLARLIKKDHKKKCVLASVDIYRPAALEQLQTLGRAQQIDVFPADPKDVPLKIAKDALKFASQHVFDVLILDTAGRLQIDQELMQELQEISAAIQPHEILLVADGMTGQESVNVAKGFDQALEIDGLILTKLDGDTRGGAALSMRAVTGRPIKFIGLGEKPEALEVFHPERMASRILGMGDVLTLIEKAVQEVSLEESLELQRKLKRSELTLDDFLNQLRMVRRMGNIGSLASMLPGMGKLAKEVDPEKAEKEMKHIEAIILSMTPGERRNHVILNATRKRRIAKGSGTSVEKINLLLRQFMEMRKMMKSISKMGMGGMMNLFGGKGLAALKGGMR
ncbi:MAG: signal recognition particle protein [Proteobacteria bacterium]|nr:MAG: signal recognition particle protein [Pseudomonadota bacterium]